MNRRILISIVRRRRATSMWEPSTEIADQSWGSSGGGVLSSSPSGPVRVEM